ncbi:hypothetical protein MNBD_GAMMA19-959, partial [hydrothermal vent metagenome]
MSTHSQHPKQKPEQTDASHEDSGHTNAYERMRERTLQLLDENTRDL